MQVAIALGSNLNDRRRTIQSAASSLARLDGVRVLRTSQVEETEAIGPSQPRYLNQMVLVETTLALPILLAQLQAIEAKHGRTRTEPKGARTLDLDIVWADAPVCCSDELLVPHPGLNDRDFWQRELAELLGPDCAARAIAAAQVHAGMDTSHQASVAS